MAHQIIGIDHVLVAVKNLTAVGQTFARLGFAVSPEGHHAEWGTTNRCLMFERDYVELIAASADGSGARRVAAHLAERGEGLMGIALGIRDAQSAYESLQRSGIAALPPTPLARSLMTPDGEVTLQFSVVNLPDEPLPGLPIFLCQHLTPDLLRRPEWLAHSNGAKSIVSLTVLAECPEALMGTYNRIFGPAASTPTDELVTVHSGHGLVYLVTNDGFGDLHPDSDLALPQTPALVLLTIGVDDLDRTAAFLFANGVKGGRKGDHLTVDPEDSLGVGLEFVQL